MTIKIFNNLAITSALIIGLLIYPVYPSNASYANSELVETLQLDGREVKFDYENHRVEREVALKYFLEKYEDNKLFSGTKIEEVGVYLFDIDNDGKEEIFAYINARNKCTLCACPFIILKKSSQEVDGKKYRVIPWYTIGREADYLMRYTGGSTKILKTATLGYRDILTRAENNSAFVIWEWTGSHYQVSKILDKDESGKNVIVSRGEFEISTESMHNSIISKDDKDNDIRNITIGGIELNIPRAFLIGSSRRTEKDDSTDKSLLLAFTYPEITGGMGYGYDYVSLWIEDTKEYDAAAREISETLQKEAKVSREQWDNLETEIVKRIKMIKEKCNGEIPNYLSISRWDNGLMCDHKESGINPRCKLSFFYKKLYISITFKARDMNKMESIKQSALNLLQQWEDKTYENK